jgi:hypothetical protein
MILDVGTVWMGHDTPKTGDQPKGSSTVFVDGSAQWCRPGKYQEIWINPSGYRNFMGSQ